MSSLIIAGSRTILSKPDNSFNVLKLQQQDRIIKHNLELLDNAIMRTGWHTQAVNMHHYKGKDLPAGSVRIDRQSDWGNPYTHLNGNTLAEFKVATREQSIDAYVGYYAGNQHLENRIDELKGKRLLCWCRPASCHGNFLAEQAGKIDTVICGTARGADTLGKLWAQGQYKVDVDDYPAHWDKYGRSAGMIRNGIMGDFAHCAVILLDCTDNQEGSMGSRNMISEMAKRNKPCYVQRVAVDEFGMAYEL